MREMKAMYRPQIILPRNISIEVPRREFLAIGFLKNKVIRSDRKRLAPVVPDFFFAHPQWRAGCAHRRSNALAFGRTEV